VPQAMPGEALEAGYLFHRVFNHQFKPFTGIIQVFTILGLTDAAIMWAACV
jgi:hypothetical protein